MDRLVLDSSGFFARDKQHMERPFLAFVESAGAVAWQFTRQRPQRRGSPVLPGLPGFFFGNKASRRRFAPKREARSRSLPPLGFA
jgi:hypothetical protein